MSLFKNFCWHLNSLPSILFVCRLVCRHCGIISKLVRAKWTKIHMPTFCHQHFAIVAVYIYILLYAIYKHQIFIYKMWTYVCWIFDFFTQLKRKTDYKILPPFLNDSWPFSWNSEACAYEFLENRHEMFVWVRVS